MTRTTVAVIYGGRSSEHAISCISAASVLEHLDRDKYEVVPVGITESGVWVRGTEDLRRLRLVGGQLPSVDGGQEPAVLSLDPSQPGIWFRPDSGPARLQRVDVVFPVLHGPNGEDGSIQGLFELAGLPFVGSGVFASAACMDKGFTKTVLAAGGLDVGRWNTLHRDDWKADPAAAIAASAGLGWPLFVKPARAGSSMGVVKVPDREALAAAIAHALGHDPRLVLEASVENAREIECGVLQRADGSVSASVPAEIRVREGHEFYDFEAKYLDDSVDLLVPAPIHPSLQTTIQDLAIRAFRGIACEGLARVDFFITPDDRIVINEINTMPGFTPISMYPRMWQETGVGYAKLLDVLLEQALARGSGLR